MKPPKNFSFIGLKPFEHQLEGLAFGISYPNVGLLYDMGTGKTRIAIDIVRYRKQANPEIQKVLTVCPISTFNGWTNQIEKFSEYKSIVIYGTKNQRIYQIEKFKNEDITFGVINYAALPLFLNYLAEVNLSIIIYDESARYIKNPFSNRSRASFNISRLPSVRHRLMLTGTPISNYPLDVWSQFYATDLGKTFGDSFFAFRGYFFNKTEIAGHDKFLLKWDRAEVLKKKIFTICIRKKKEECLDLPEKIFDVMMVEMSYSLSKIYNSVKKKVIEEILEDGSTKSNPINILTKLIRLQQVTAGFLIEETGGPIIPLKETPKLDALIEDTELIIDAEESVVIWCRFRESIRLISERLKDLNIKYIIMHGGTKDKGKAWGDFQKDKTIPVFIGQQESGGIGIELFKLESKAKYQHTRFYEHVWQFDVRDQAIDRIHRIGQESICIYKDLIVKDTIDQKIFQVNLEKKMISEILIDNRSVIEMINQ